MTPDVKVGETGGQRWFIGAFPQPKWDKNDRTGVVLNETARMKKGQRFMAPDAREYREQVVNVVMPALIAAGADRKEGWFRKGRLWGGVLIQGFSSASFDQDHYAAGLLDDLCHAGLAKHDKDCWGFLPMKSALAPSDRMFAILFEGYPSAPPGVES